jgi:hypothetical protein
MKVIATDVSKRYNLRLKELHRVANPGEIFEVTEDRFVYLNGNNPRGYKVVEWYQEPEEVVVPEVEDEPIPLVASAAAIELDDGTIIENPTFEMFTEVVSEEPVVEEKPKKKSTKKKTTKKKVEEKAE